MKKFSSLTKSKKIFEQEVTLQPVQPVQPVDTQNTQNDGVVAVTTDATVSTEVKAEVNTGSEGSQVIKLLSKLFETKEMAHIYHLQVKGDEGSNATHLALEDYYEGSLDIIDDIIEVYQGQYGIVDGYDIIDTKETTKKDAIAYFEESAELIKNYKKSIATEDSHIHGLIDDLFCLLYKTLYKLKFTK